LITYPRTALCYTYIVRIMTMDKLEFEYRTQIF
jgi:hypothetical protein